MTGKAVGLTERDRAVIREIGRFGVMTRDQLLRLRYFTSKTRAKTRLKQLVDAGYLAARRQPLPIGGPRYVYLPGTLTAPDARRRVLALSDPFLAHELGLVDIHIAFERQTTLTRWTPPSELDARALGLLPDAYLEYQRAGLTYCAFLEYDRGTETLGRIERKVRSYLDLAHSGRFERLFRRRFFRVLLVADTAGRLATLARTAARVTDTIVWLTTLTVLSEQGPLRSIWQRPGTTNLEPLTHS